MPNDRLLGVRTARRVEPTASRQCRTYPPTVRDDGRDQHLGTGCRRPWAALLGAAHRDRRSRGDLATAMAASRSVASRGYDACAAAGSARTTRVLPSGRSVNRSRTSARSRRRTRLRVTALPTALDTTKPARDGTDDCSALLSRTGSGEVGVLGSTVAGTVRWTTTAPRPARRPPRTAAAKSVLRRSRCAAASTTAHVPWTGPVGSGRQGGATLGATARQDGTAGTGAHAQPEAVGLRAPAVVRLVGALAHVRLSVFVRAPRDGIAGVVWWSRPPRRWPTIGAVRRSGDFGVAGMRPRTASTHHPSRGRESSRSSLRRGAMTVKHPEQGTTGRARGRRAVFADADKGAAASPVDGAGTTLLPCPIAVSVGSSGRRAGKTGHGSESFGTVNPLQRPFRRGQVPPASGGGHNRSVHRLWITCG